jgi:tRNA dimethylallyltransferase
LAGGDRTIVPVICGPTASGKSAIALWLAKRAPITVIAADSRQIYRGFDIGTAKPTAIERAAVPHRGIDLVAPTERYSAATWAADADRWIDEARVAGREPIVVGGTGFYLRALFEPLFHEPELDQARRHALQRVLAQLSLSDLARWTQALDPARAHFGRTQLLRAIEVALLTGHRLSVLHRERARPARRTARYLVVDPGPALATRIVDRLDAMIAGGWVNEVQRLTREVPGDAPAWKATGYRVMRDCVRGAIDLSAAREQILIETRQYAKRQRTWLRHQLDAGLVTRVDPLADSWPEQVEQWWRAVAPLSEARRA